MTQPTDRIRQLADEIRNYRAPDAYAMGRIRGFVEGAGTTEEKLACIAEVVAAWDLALREPDASRPMTGAEALDAARTPEEWAATANSIFGAIADAAERDDEDGAS